MYVIEVFAWPALFVAGGLVGMWVYQRAESRAAFRRRIND
jgi:hypothetical protein